jgi:hypothetical protein
MHRDARSSELRRLLLPIFGHRSHIAIADNAGQGNATTGIADLADYYTVAVGAEFVARLNVQPTGFSSPRDGRRGLVDQVEDLVTVPIARWVQSAARSGSGRYRRGGYGVRSSNKQFWVFQQ